MEAFRLGASATGTQAHLASFQNTSRWNYRRDRNVADYQAPNVHNCSLQVVRNASADPLKYVMKYFGVKANEAHLADVEKLGQDITRLEEALNNIRQREASITASVNPPAFIMKFFASEFMMHVGVELSPIGVPYPVYAFEYISAGGNSSQRTTVTLDTPVIDALVETLSQKIRSARISGGVIAGVAEQVLSQPATLGITADGESRRQDHRYRVGRGAVATCPTNRHGVLPRRQVHNIRLRGRLVRSRSTGSGSRVV